MANNNGTVDGRLGDISGRLGDISGRLGDISGRLGDISGRASSADVQDCLLEDREADKVRFIEGRIARIESEILLVVRWVNAQVQGGTSNATPSVTTEDVSTLRLELAKLRDRVEKLEKLALSPSQPQPVAQPQPMH